MISGQFGQPTILGFSVFAMGLAMAAVKLGTEDDADDGPPPALAVAPQPRIARRSEYASRLHGPPAGHGHTNGSTHH
jgi:hypothetical protein